MPPSSRVATAAGEVPATPASAPAPAATETHPRRVRETAAGEDKNAPASDPTPASGIAPTACPNGHAHAESSAHTSGPAPADAATHADAAARIALASAPAPAPRPHRARAAAAAAVATLALAASLARPIYARADVTRTQKVELPVITTYEVREGYDATVAHASIDASQGRDLPFSVAGTMPVNLASRPTLEYWMVATPEDTLKYIPGSAKVTLRRTYYDGTIRTFDVTDQLTVRQEGGSIVAGAANIKEAIDNLSASDVLTLTYAVRFNFDNGTEPHLGTKVHQNSYGATDSGNSSYAHVEYSAATAQTGSWADSEAAPLRSLRATEPRVTHAQGTAQPAQLATPVVSDIPARQAATAPAPAATTAPAATRTAASHSTDVRSTTSLLKSPDVKATVFCYLINIHAVDAADTGKSLAGASFALREADGTTDEGGNTAWNWYVARSSWVSSTAEPPRGATVSATTDTADASFLAISSESYELLPVAAPAGYKPLDGVVDVALHTNTTSSMTGAPTTLSAASSKAAVSRVNAEDGVVTLQVAYTADPNAGNGGNNGGGGNSGTGGNSGNSGNNGGSGNAGGRTNSGNATTGGNSGLTTNPGSNGGSSGGSSDSLSPIERIASLLPKTGDAVFATALVATISILALLAGLALRRGQGRWNRPNGSHRA